MWCFSVCNTLMLTWTWQPNWWVGAQEGKAEDYLPALSFHSKSKQQRSMMIFLPNKLGKNMFKSHKAELWKLPFSRQLLHHTMRCAPLGRIGLKLLLLVEMWCSCTTTKCAGINIPVLVVSWGTLSPLTEKLADSSCAELCAQPGKGQACQGVCCLSTENGTLWSVAGVDLWLLSAALLQSLLQAIILSKVIPALCLSLMGRCSLLFIKHW